MGVVAIVESTYERKFPATGDPRRLEHKRGGVGSFLMPQVSRQAGFKTTHQHCRNVRDDSAEGAR